VWEYGRNEGISVTGGYVYRGTTLAALNGAFVYGDFGSGKIWALGNGTTSPSNQLLVDSPRNISSFGEDAEGELYVVSYQDGRLYRLAGPTTSASISFPISSMTLHQNYPNPFNPSTTVRFVLDRSAHIVLEVFDVLGRRVSILADGMMSGGHHSVVFDAGKMAGGVYVYRLSTPTGTLQRIMLLAR
jgi:hypothetical protein